MKLLVARGPGGPSRVREREREREKGEDRNSNMIHPVVAMMFANTPQLLRVELLSMKGCQGGRHWEAENRKLFRKRFTNAAVCGSVVVLGQLNHSLVDLAFLSLHVPYWPA